MRSSAPGFMLTKSGSRMVMLFLAVVCIVAVTLTLYSYGKQEPDSSQSQAVSSVSMPTAGAAVSAETAVPAPSSVLVPEDVPPDTAPDPVPEAKLVMPEGGWPQLAFTEDEISLLDQLLTEWASSVPVEPESLAATSDQSGGSDVTEGPAPHGTRVSVYFKDLDSGAEYCFDADDKYPIASLSKAPYAMYLYTLVENGVCSLDEEFYIDEEWVEESANNSGRIKDDPDLPRTFTLEELIHYLLRYSDTLAQRVLLDRYPAEGYTQWAAGLGLAYPEDVRGVTSGLITARDAGVYLIALEDYMENGAYGLQLKDHLYNTSYPMIRSEYPVARKYGWDEGAYHDMAVVYTQHPYVLAILTDKSAGDWNDHAMFQKVAGTFEEIMGQKWRQ